MDKVEVIMDVLPPRLAKKRDPDEIMEFLQERKRKVIIAIRLMIVMTIVISILLLVLIPVSLGLILIVVWLNISESIACYFIYKRATYTEYDVYDYIKRFEKTA